LPELACFLRALPEDYYHLVDLPYRLSSPTMQTGQDACLWRAEDGTIVGFAAWQHDWAMLDYFVHPAPTVSQEMVEQAIFGWAQEYFRELDRARGWTSPCWIPYRPHDQTRCAALANYGFHLDGDHFYLRLRYDLSHLSSHSQASVPAGMTIRSLAGQQEVDACAALHRAAFESDAMTSEWRARLLRTPQYQPELDLVVVTEDGELAGYCLGWLDQTHRVGQLEPLAIDPRFHRRGLGRALQLELLRRFQILQARYVLVEPDTSNPAAVATYLAMGFYESDKVLLKGKWMMQSPARPV
jgi:ribosomal protein S18 acetylase RimI-like enzyme